MNQLRVVSVVCAPDKAELCADQLLSLGAFAIEERNDPVGVELRTVIDNDLPSVHELVLTVDPTAKVKEVFVDRNVLDEWKQYATATQIDETLTIVPAWLCAEGVSDARQIVIEPEVSFGIGDHPTTRLCAAWLQKQDMSQQRVLDAGCGTGVLSIVAARRGAMVTAVDIAENALAVTRRNAALNNVEMEAVHDWSDLDSDAKFNVIVANILAPALIELSTLFASHLEPDGRIALAGLRTEQAERVLNAYPKFKVVERDSIDGWELLVIQRD